jgi:hypothetical protein
MTTWSPDTCECVLEYSDPDIKHVTSHKLCPKHAALEGQGHLDVVLAHNQKRNQVAAHVRDTHGAARKARGDLSGGPNISVQYDADDVLVVTGLPADTPVKQAELEAKFGRGKVRIG